MCYAEMGSRLERRIFIQQGKTGKQIKAWSPRLQAAIEKQNSYQHPPM